MAQPSVSVKVEPAIFDELNRRAVDQGKTRAAYVRDVILDHLEADESPDQSHESLQRDLTKIYRELRSFRNSHMTSVAGLLTYLGKCSQQEAEQWVEEHL